MNFRKRLTTTFPKLIISFALTVIISTLSLGFIFYYYFTHNFNSKVEQVNLKMLEHLNDMINGTVYKPLDQVYTEITVFNNSDFIYLYNNDMHYNLSKVYSIYNRLKDIVEANSHLIDSICIYYKEWNSIITYPGGVRYLNDLSSNINSIYPEILNRFSSCDDKIMLTETYNIKETPYFTSNIKSICSIVFSYPSNLPGILSKGAIIINMKEEAIYNIIKQSYPETAGFIFIVDKQNNIISHSSSKTTMSELISAKLLSAIVNNEAVYNNTLENVNGVQSIISYITLYGGHWRLVNVTPVDQFYKESAIIGRTIIMACIIVLVIGLMLANVFSIKLYSPVKMMMNNVINLLDHSQKNSVRKENEYEFINNVINIFSSKISHLENTLTLNRPILKHNLVSDLFENSIKKNEELRNRLSLVGINSPLEHYCVMILELENNIIDSLSTQNNQFIKYNIVEYIESQSSNGFICLSALTSNYRISIFINHENFEMDDFYNLAQKLLSYISMQFKVRAIISLIKPCNSLAGMHNSVKTAKTLLNYAFFLPDENIITEGLVGNRISNKEKIPNTYVENFMKALKSRQINDIIQSISSINNIIMYENYSSECSKKVLLQMLATIKRYTEEENIDAARILGYDLFEKFKTVRNIKVFESWMLDVCSCINNYIEENDKNSTTMIIQAACEFIEDNLEAQLSLDMISEKVFINPTYLSKIFKDETGENFTNYINRLRLEKAKELLLTSNMKIDDIALVVGFNNTNYFIKKFKQMYGTTPKLYKLQAVL